MFKKLTILMALVMTLTLLSATGQAVHADTYFSGSGTETAPFILSPGPNINKGYPYLSGFNIIDKHVGVPETEVLVPGVDDSGTLLYNINLNTEKLEQVTDTSLTIKSYSIDGGTKWKAGTPFDKNTSDSLTKILDKGSKLVLATEVQDKKTKEFPEGTIKVTFAEIAKREKTDKRIVNYLILSIDNWQSADAVGLWTLTKTANDTVASIDGISYSLADSTGKKSDGSWFGFPEAGIKVQPLPDTGKVGKVIYFYHTVPGQIGDKYTPAGKTAKLTVSTQIKAPTLKPDYKKEVIKAKAGLSVQVGTADAKLFTKYDKGNELLIDLKGAIDKGEKVTVFTVATVKKPASASQVLQIATRPDIHDAKDAVSINSGKVKLGEGYEVYDEIKDKWGSYKACPSNQVIILTDDDTMIRKKSTVKLGKDGNVISGTPASTSCSLVVSYKNTAAEGKKPSFKPDSVKIGRYVYQDNLKWVVFSDHVMLAGFSRDANTDKLSNELVIPDTFQDKPVTGIMRAAFYGAALKKVTFPDTITEVGHAAFAQSQVNEIIFSPDSSLNTICAAAFSGCSKLTAISLPKGLKQIGSYAFRGTPLTEAVFYGSKPLFYNLDNKADDGEDVFENVSSDFKIKYHEGDESWVGYTKFPTQAISP